MAITIAAVWFMALADRLLLLSISPARIVADVPVARPRAAHTPAELAALREEIARVGCVRFPPAKA